MAQRRPESTTSKLDRILEQQDQIIAAQTDGHVCEETRVMVEYVKRKQDEHIEVNNGAHERIFQSVSTIDSLVTGNGGVGIAEEVRILKRGYRAVLWLGGVVTTAIVVQTVIAVMEHYWPAS